MTRRFDLVGFVCGCVVFAVILLLAGMWVDAENRARTAPSRERVDTIEQKCQFFTDGSATCPSGVFTTMTEAK